MRTVEDPRDRAIRVARDEVMQGLTSLWVAFLLGESQEVQQRYIDDCAQFLYAQLPVEDIVAMLFATLGPEAKQRAQALIDQVPQEEDGRGRVVISYERE